MAHVLVAGKLHGDALSLLADADGVTFDYIEEVSEDSYTPFLGRADALLLRTQPLREAAIAGAERLKIVSRHGVGYDAVASASSARASWARPMSSALQAPRRSLTCHSVSNFTPWRM